MTLLKDLPSGQAAWCTLDAFEFQPLGDASYLTVNLDSETYPNYHTDFPVWIAKCPNHNYYGFVSHDSPVRMGIFNFEQKAHIYAKELILHTNWMTTDCLIRQIYYTIKDKGQNTFALRGDWLHLLQLYLSTVDLEYRKEERKVLQKEFLNLTAEELGDAHGHSCS